LKNGVSLLAMEIFELLQFPFVQRMLLAAFFASIACGIIGTYVVVKRIVFISGGIAHTTFGGIGFAYYLQQLGILYIEPLFGALIFSLISAFIIGLPYIRNRLREDSTIGILWVVGMALGVLFLNQVDRSKIVVQDPVSILFGNVLLIKIQDLYLMLGLIIAILTITILLYKDLQILTFDEEFARISGIRVDLLYLVLMILIALTTVVLIKVVGVILVIAMLTIPAAISNLFTHNLKNMMIFAIIIGIIISFFGSMISLYYNLPPGATIVITLAFLFLLSLILKNLKISYRKDIS
jgi:zinc transport system permease protein